MRLARNCVDAPVEVIVPVASTLVNAPVLGVVAPMAVEFRPVEVMRPYSFEPIRNEIGSSVPVPDFCDAKKLKPLPVSVPILTILKSAAELCVENPVPPEFVVATAPLNVPVVPVIVVAETVLGVVAPTVPLILIDAVPVRFVTVPLDGVPSGPPP